MPNDASKAAVGKEEPLSSGLSPLTGDYVIRDVKVESFESKRASLGALPALELRGTRWSSEADNVLPEEEPNGLPPNLLPPTNAPKFRIAPPDGNGGRALRYTGPQEEPIPESPSSSARSQVSSTDSAISVDSSTGGGIETKRFLTKSKLHSRAKTEMPAIDELTSELNITAEHLESCKRQTYQRTFRLWMPMVHDFNASSPEDEELAELMTEVLPVDELLDRVMLRRVRVSAVERSIVFLLFNFIYCTCLIMQRSLSDSYELESALKVRAIHFKCVGRVTLSNSLSSFVRNDNRLKLTLGGSGFPLISQV
jgi:hypothetical protein